MVAIQKMNNLLTLNITLHESRNGLVQTMQLPYNICWTNLESILKASFDVEDILLMYIDDDKEMINMSSPEELKEATQVARKNKNKLNIVVSFPAVNQRKKDSHSLRSSAERGKAKSMHKPPVDEEIGAVSRSKPTKTQLTMSSPVVHHFATKLESDKRHGSLCDSESGETSPEVTSNQQMITENPGVTNNVSYQSLVQLLEQLKHELKTEIVRDVISKTVEQVLENASGNQKVSAEATNQTGSQLQDQQYHVLYWHEGVTCDGCKHTIVGVRYKCGNCLDYDLCEQCENQPGMHIPNHVFLKLRRPCRLAGMINEMKPLLQYVLYSDVADQIPPPQQPYSVIAYENIPEDLRRQYKYARKMAKMLNRKKKEEKLFDLQRRHEEKGKRSFKQSRNLPIKKERLDFVDPIENIAAAFVKDVTIPDDTKVLPSTRLIKTWRIKNTGKSAWTNKTVMCLKSGNIQAMADEVSVPLLLPGEEGNVSVHLLAPSKPGKYQSNWMLYYGSQSFGPCVWCSIVVGNDEQGESNASAKSKEPHSKEVSTSVLVSSVDHHQLGTESPSVTKMDDKVLSNAVAGAMAKLSLKPTNNHLQQDLLSFEMLNMHDRSIARASHTATPNNTPLDVSPPKSPTPDMDQPTVSSSNSSSVELLPEDMDTESNHFASELAHHIGGMALKPVLETDADVESLATLSDDDSSSQYDSDFYIVPLPDCFDPSKPLLPSMSEGSSQQAPQLDGSIEAQLDDNHNTIVVASNNLPPSQACAASVDELMTCANVNAPPPLHPTLAMADESGKEVEAASSPSSSQTRPPHLLLNPSNMAADAAAAGECVDTNPNNVLLQRRQQQQHHHHHHQQQQEVEAAGAPAESGHFAMAHQPTMSNMDINAATGQIKEVDVLPSSPSDFANQLMSTAVNAASRAAAQAYSTAKDVFFSLQARPVDRSIQHVPYYQHNGTSNVGTNNLGLNIASGFTGNTPGIGVQRQWPKPRFQHEINSPMNQLIEMGFANRDINQRLLDKHANNVEKVVQEILQTEGMMTWHTTRH